MITDNQILFRHWKKSRQEFQQHLVSLQERITAAAIHDIRVAVKRLRAFLKLYQYLKKEPGWEYLFVKTDAFFAVLGRYRDTEICLEQLAGYKKEYGQTFNGLSDYLRQQLKTTRGWANREIHLFHKKELAKIALLIKQDPGLADKDQLYGSIHEAISNQLEDIKKHFRKPHLVRKKLKDIYYWMAILPEEPLWKERQRELHLILDDFGKWQDRNILEQRVRHFLKDFLPAPFEEHTRLKEWMELTRESKKKLLQNANRMTGRWIIKMQSYK